LLNTKSEYGVKKYLSYSLLCTDKEYTHQICLQ